MRILVLFFPKKNTRVSFLFISAKRLNFFFSKTNKILLLYYTRERTSSLCDDAFKEQQQQQQQHATTTKESTFEKSGEREDGFEGTRERRTGVRVFEEDS